ncbi:hypothetical protein U1Q18_010037, partial [Sarracenia purpurea var. burkii]
RNANPTSLTSITNFSLSNLLLDTSQRTPSPTSLDSISALSTIAAIGGAKIALLR